MMCQFCQKRWIRFYVQFALCKYFMLFGQERLGSRSGSGHITVRAPCIFSLFTDRVSCSHNIAEHSASWQDLF